MGWWRRLHLATLRAAERRHLGMASPFGYVGEGEGRMRGKKAGREGSDEGGWGRGDGISGEGFASVVVWWRRLHLSTLRVAERSHLGRLSPFGYAEGG